MCYLVPGPDHTWRQKARPLLRCVHFAKQRGNVLPESLPFGPLEVGEFGERILVADGSQLGILLPALPGSGKSTLTAALVCHGYRLLSDEFGVVDMKSGTLHPLLRPVGLKNASIDLIAGLARPGALGPRYSGTRKGTVAHLAPDRRSVRMCHVAAVPGIVLFPSYAPGARAAIEDIEEGRAFSKLAVNAFNYRVLGREAFDAVARLVRECRPRRLVFGDPVDALRLVDELVEAINAPIRRTGTG